MVRVCYDDLFRFLQELAHPTGKPFTLPGHYSGSATTYQTVLDYEVPADYELDVDFITLFSDAWSNTVWKLAIADISHLDGDTFQTSITLTWRNATVRSRQRVLLQCKSSSGAIAIDAVLTGNLREVS